MDAPTDPPGGPHPAATGSGPAPGASSGGEPPTGRSLATDLAIGVVVIAVIAAAIWGVPALTGGTASPSASPVASGGAEPSTVAAASSSAETSIAASAAPSPAPSIPLPGPTQLPGGPFASSGAMAVLGADGSLTLVAADGRATPLAPADDNPVTFPAWSPDGTRIAAIRLGTGTSEIVVFDAREAAAGTATPTVILDSSTIGPFYLSWSPDGRTVSYLAEDPTGLSLRLAPADGSAPVDGSGPGSRVGSGNPFYFDWIGSDRLLAHVGTGSDAFLGEMHLDGTAAAPGLVGPGSFRSPVVSADAAWISYVRAAATADGPASVVTSKRDGSGERTMPVFGMASVAFSPIAPMIASIGPTAAAATPFNIPFGPLRVLDATTGKARTLLDGTVVSDWWSPDGKTIAAIVVQPAGSPSAPGASASTASATASPSPTQLPVAGSPEPAASPAPSASPTPQEVRVVFVDVTSGAIKTDAAIEPGRLFIDQYLTYFDQYATSHQLWAPDSSSILIPVDDATGSRLRLVPRAGGTPKLLDGVMGAWSP